MQTPPMETGAAVDAELPEYRSPAVSGTQRAASSRSEHRISLETSKGYKWLKLVINSRAASSKQLPYFVTGDVITGRVELDLEKAESYKGITVTLTGGVTLVGQDENVFLKIEKELWNPDMVTPDGIKTSKLKGKFSWPFEITMPNEVEVQDGKITKKFPTPPSFSERASTAYIDYKVTITVRRGTFKVNQTLVMTIAFMPLTRSDPPSALRQLAYQERSPLVGPEGDPEGWDIMPPISVKGTLFGAKNIEVNCTLALATPLNYARGGPLPLSMTFASEDSQALDLLSTPLSIRLLLARSLAIGSDSTAEVVSRRSNNFFREIVGRAVFWPSEEGAKEEGKRVMNGELDIKSTLKPSFTFPRLTVRYTLELMPFQAAGFAPAVQAAEPLLSRKIQISTLGPLGIAPHNYAPPAYVQEQATDYNLSVGLLENGNQRFLHHGHSGGLS